MKMVQTWGRGRRWIWPALLLLCAAGAFAAIALGSVSGSPAEVWRAFWGEGDPLLHDVIWRLRLPRAYAAFACGGLLALSGVLLQVLLRNPLADPYVLGVSGGAGLGALAAMALGAGAAAANGAAFAGAIAAIALVFALAARSRDWDVQRLLLTGVVLSAGFSAVTSLLLVIAPQLQARGMLFWLMGDLSTAGHSSGAWWTLMVILALSFVFGRELDVLGLGALKARALGVAVVPLQRALYFGAAAATVAAVVVGGSIGFVGMMVPHALRLLGVQAHRALLPAAVLGGGSFVLLADTLARTLWAPQQLPVGVFTALMGVPALLVLLGRRRAA